MGLCLLQTHSPVVLILTCVSGLAHVSNPTKVITKVRNMLTALNAEPMYSHKISSLPDLNTLLKNILYAFTFRITFMSLNIHNCKYSIQLEKE